MIVYFQRTFFFHRAVSECRPIEFNAIQNVNGSILDPLFEVGFVLRSGDKVIVNHNPKYIPARASINLGCGSQQSDVHHLKEKLHAKELSIFKLNSFNFHLELHNPKFLKSPVGSPRPHLHPRRPSPNLQSQSRNL
jgi:hypothetical protein